MKIQTILDTDSRSKIEKGMKSLIGKVVQDIEDENSEGGTYVITGVSNTFECKVDITGEFHRADVWIGNLKEVK